MLFYSCIHGASGIIIRSSSAARVVLLWQLPPFLPRRSCCIIFFRAPVDCIASFSFFLSLYSIFLFSFCHFFFSPFFFLTFFFFSWSGLFCCVIVLGTLPLHLFYLDELRELWLFGLLCFTAVLCDHRICLGWIISARTAVVAHCTRYKKTPQQCLRNRTNKQKVLITIKKCERFNRVWWCGLNKFSGQSHFVGASPLSGDTHSYCTVVFGRVRRHHTRDITPGITLRRTSLSSVGQSYAYPELLEVLYDSHTCTRNFWKFCTPVPQIPGTRVYHFYNLCDLCTPVLQYPKLLYARATIPGTSANYVTLPYRTRNFCKFC